MQGLFITTSKEPFKCPKGCEVEAPFFAYCPVCEGVSSANCFHDLEAFKVHFEYYSTEGRHYAFTPFKEYSLNQLCDALEVTVKKDRASKSITFLDCLLAETEEDQFNIMFRAWSSTGKSYIPLEVAQYFPEDEVIIYSGASPTSFFHEKGVLVIETQNGYEPLEVYADPLSVELEELKAKDRRTAKDKQRIRELKGELGSLYAKSKTLVDLEKKILIFTDQPNTQLLIKMRSFLSHDRKFIEFSITDSLGRGGHRTKHIVLAGYACVIFCTVSQDYDEQEANRHFILSPESEQNKIIEALKLQDEKLSDREHFREMLQRDEKRSALILRVEAIRASEVRRITAAPGVVFEKFLELHKEGVQSRAPRDFQRLYSLIYGHALLNVFTRERSGNSVAANMGDIEAGFDLYKPIMEANEMGLSPETYLIFNGVFKPSFEKKNRGASISAGLGYSEICQAYQKHELRILSYEQCKATMRALTFAGLVSEEQDEKDRRKVVFLPLNREINFTQSALPYSLQSNSR